MSFLNDIGRSLSNSVKSELRYEMNKGIRQGVKSAINKGQQVISDEWKCSCGTKNTGKFCMNCGKARTMKIATCSKCGWSSDTVTPKFCPECGNPIGEEKEQPKSDDTIPPAQGKEHYDSPVGKGIALENMQEYMHKVTPEEEQHFRSMETPADRQSSIDFLRQTLNFSKEARNMTMGNMSVITAAMGDVLRQDNREPDAKKVDDFAQSMTDIANGKYDSENNE